MNNIDKSITRYYLVVTITSWGEGYEKESYIPVEVTSNSLTEEINSYLWEAWFECDQDSVNFLTDNPYGGYTFFGGQVREYLSHLVSINEEDYNVLKRYL